MITEHLVFTIYLVLTTNTNLREDETEVQNAIDLATKLDSSLSLWPTKPSSFPEVSILCLPVVIVISLREHSSPFLK